MNKKQSKHSKHIRDTFDKLQKAKYEAGAKEHGTILYELDPVWLLEQAREEFIDGFTYVQTAIDILGKQITIDIEQGSPIDGFLRDTIVNDLFFGTSNGKTRTRPQTKN